MGRRHTRSLWDGWRTAAAVAAVGGPAVAGAAVAGADEDAMLLVAYLALAAVELVAAGMLWRVSARLRSRARLAWGMFAGAMAIWAASDVTNALATYATGDRQPAVVSVGWLLFYPLALGAAVLVYERLRPERGRQGLFDAVVVVMAVAFVGWVALLSPAAPGADQALLALYPALDLVGVALLGWLVLRHRRDTPAWVTYIAAAFGVQFLGGLTTLPTDLPAPAVFEALGVVAYASAACLWIEAARRRGRDAKRAWQAAIHSTPPVWTGVVPFGSVAVMVATLATVPAGPARVLVVVAALVVATVRVGETLVVNDRLIRERDRLLITDPLTGAFNRRFLEGELDRALARAARGGHECALIAVDLDNFKVVNDTLGHASGDALLTEIVRALSERLRRGDVVCRVGGDEFLVVAPETGRAEAVGLAERLRGGVVLAAEALAPGAGVTATFGVAVYPHCADDAEGLQQQADRALYDGKRAGRDRVVAGPLGATGAQPATAR